MVNLSNYFMIKTFRNKSIVLAKNNWINLINKLKYLSKYNNFKELKPLSLN